ncbi:ExsB [Sulfurimonas denitrificans DSM 1251]|uniref:7-cyano-7-deazaguanine synthase n=1 Tax=Sulfurimonas denitrificans (strain ATCC 33889 / DSM 1251) TaxID=326298 RepID=QUEC_SULDN|nr:7-cyano-7-deazaguanine synthase QueC [Sulfurimonas denitrificans]Q30RN3.1 RecName: Full=7-cyano-7-deazaguanine synthase; AltName: Full=7-cyano-7-carbaguanine synthase; AltName: Full=PreQ(0) synthase; AltName: Full=Queuosine biosynthesis protein QueC [Sulfurimonas denitrificans DSM 1251]ABB44348.1 ExsB [Sulfurimonas denitrificans DSM 1251]MDD3441957.1 7-cyano-7-deazaguanine synthase QueC [Sulfurimonas denitrificans]
MNLKNKKAICIMSGGMDSTLGAYMVKEMGYEIVALHFNYAQRTEAKELFCFKKICEALNVSNSYVLDLDFFSKIGASALTDKSIDIPINGLEEGVPITYVPFRNGIFLSIAAALAEKEEAVLIAIGVVQEDSSGYPDCKDSFITSMEQSINLGTKDETKIKIYMPLVHLSKSQIVEHALRLNVPLELTWSCYKDEEAACGVCDSCRLRLNGFRLANAKDPIEYM